MPPLFCPWRKNTQKELNQLARTDQPPPSLLKHTRESSGLSTRFRSWGAAGGKGCRYGRLWWRWWTRLHWHRLRYLDWIALQPRGVNISWWESAVGHASRVTGLACWVAGAVSGSGILCALHLGKVPLLGMGVTTGGRVAGNAAGSLIGNEISAVGSVAKANLIVSWLLLLEADVLQSPFPSLLSCYWIISRSAYQRP